jgi:hypothetical protein
MSRGLHVATTYKVEWSELTSFRLKSYEFRLLLNELGVGVSSLCSTDDDDYLDFEVKKEDWVKAITQLNSLQCVPEPKRVIIKDLLNQLGVTANEAAVLFSKYLGLAEPDDEWLHFSFF